jgi:glycosyltransferase involved in cell wall biosynthesis
MPVYNCKDYVAEAFDSILAQTYPASEIIVVDDSTDETSDIVQQYVPSGIRHIHRGRKLGIYSAHNLAIELAQGDFIAFLSADDVWMPEKLELQVKLMRRQPELGYATTYFTHFIDVASPPKAEHLRPSHRPEFTGNTLLETVIVRRTLFAEHGKFSEEFQISSDVEWFARMVTRRVPTACVEQVLVNKRLHAANTNTRDIALTHSELLRILRRTVHERKT